MWFCVNSEHGACYYGYTPEEAWEQMESNFNIDIEDCDFYQSSGDSPKTFTLKLAELNPEED